MVSARLVALSRLCCTPCPACLDRLASRRIHSSPARLQIYAIIFLTVWAAEGWGQICSVVANKSMSTVAGVVSMAFIVTTGSFPLLTSTASKRFSFASYCRWSVELLFITTYRKYVRARVRGREGGVCARARARVNVW